jgi:hypothetical protein
MSVIDIRPVHGITDEFVARLPERADEAERLRRLPAGVIDWCEDLADRDDLTLYVGSAIRLLDPAA